MSMTFGFPIIYRGWEIDRYRQLDGCFYAYAPDYDGLTEWRTQLAPTLHGLCDNIDDAIEARDSDRSPNGLRRTEDCGSTEGKSAGPKDIAQ